MVMVVAVVCGGCVYGGNCSYLVGEKWKKSERMKEKQKSERVKKK